MRRLPASSPALPRRSPQRLSGRAALLGVALLALLSSRPATAQFADWPHSGSLYVLTTPEGADRPAGTVVRDFPLLVRLHRDHFPFDESTADGSDLRFSAAGRPLAHEIESWDAAVGTASVWVRVPEIRGDEQQEIRLHWGRVAAVAPAAPPGQRVFDATNGYLGVWHFGASVQDVVGTFDANDRGTTPATGVIGGARQFTAGRGVLCGTNLDSLPAGDAAHSTQAWIRPESANGRILGWGNEARAGKVTMLYQSPPRIRMDCYFSSGDVRADIPGEARGWTQVTHTYEDGRSLLYMDGELQAAGNPGHTPLAIQQPAGMWIGGWYDRYDFVGRIDEVRLSTVARSADQVRLEYENQKPLQTLVGPVVQDGDEFSVTPSTLELDEGGSAEFVARAGGARKIYWSLLRGGERRVIACDRLRLPFAAGRTSGDEACAIRIDALFADGMRSLTVPVQLRETLPEPIIRLRGPATWNGRDRIEIRPEIQNLQALEAAGVAELDARWELSGLATLSAEEPDRLVLQRAQNSGRLRVALRLGNGGEPVTASTEIDVREPATDPWITRAPSADEMPVDGQFYARAGGTSAGTLHCRGRLAETADEVFLRVYAEDEIYADRRAPLDDDRRYAFAVELGAALVHYRVEFGSRTVGVETILHRAGNLLCGDAYLITGQSNALATDTREEAPRETYEWVRSYGRPRYFRRGGRENLWCKPVWKARPDDLAELGWWGMELAKRLVASQQVPVFFVNGARGGTRIDQHQRNDADPADLDTIYGRMLWRLQQAGLTHGIRAVIWHQGESDQGAAGPDGGYGWETYQRYFIEMAADWKRDLPNVARYYTFQIRPNACSMGGGNGDMLRERQRTLAQLFSDLEVLSTLGIVPGGGCHYPLVGWGVFAERLQVLLERDFYNVEVDGPVTAPNLLRAAFADASRRTIALQFDQPVVWDPRLGDDFFLGTAGQDNAGQSDAPLAITRGDVTGSVLTLTLAEPFRGDRITYLKEMVWQPDRLLRGANGRAALSFCNVPLTDHQ